MKSSGKNHVVNQHSSLFAAMGSNNCSHCGGRGHQRLAMISRLLVLSITAVVARTHLRQRSAEDAAACSCSQCVGERRNEGGDGTVSFQCFPRSSGLADCHQAETTGEQVVQSAEFLSYDRFCLYTCKPLLRDEIKSKVDCAHLNHQEITRDAQSPSSNGKEIVYEAHPLTKVGPISKLVALPEASMLGVNAAVTSDPVMSIRGAFAKLRNLELQNGGVSAYGLPDAAKAPSLCVCHCGSKVDRFRQTESDGVIYPKPRKMPMSVTSPRSVMVEPPQPPMPPISTPITDLFGIQHPVLLAGMNIAASPQLAAAVTNAGGLGVWGGVFYTPKMFRSKLKDGCGREDWEDWHGGMNLLDSKYFRGISPGFML
eukprot:s155_g37.t1